MEDQGAKIAAAGENAAKEVTVAVDNAVKDVTAAVDHAVKDVTAAVHEAIETAEVEVQNLIDSGEEGDLKVRIVAFLRGVPKKAWFLMGLGVAGIVLASGGGNLDKVANSGIGQFSRNSIRALNRRFSRNRHHSICHYVKIQPAAFNADDPLKKRKFCAQDIFDVETKITGFGSPEWEKTHEKATKTAAVLETLKQGGATCIGKTVMDELGFRN